MKEILSNAGALGIIYDRPAHELEPEAFSEGQNVRFTDGYVEKVHGHVVALEELSVLPAAPYWNLEWLTPGDYYWIFANHTSIYRTNGTAHTDITREVAAVKVPYNGTADNYWTGGILGGVPIMNNNNGADYPQQWDIAGALMKDLANWPANTYCQFIRPFKEFLIAGGITDAVGSYPQLLRWSHPALAGGVPVTWDITDDTKLAGERPFSEGGGALIDCLSLGDLNIVYLEGAVWAMQLVQSSQVFAFRRLFNDIGMMAPNCAVEVMGRHLVIGMGDIYLHNTQTKESVVSSRLRKWFYANLNPDYYFRTFVVAERERDEVWICFPDQNSLGYANKALIWNYAKNTWGQRELPEVAFGAFGVIPKVGASLIIDDQDIIADDDTRLIDAVTFTPGQSNLLFSVPTATKLYEMDKTNTFLALPFTSYVERTGLALTGKDRFGNRKAAPSTKKFVRRVYPNLESDLPVRIYFGGQNRLGDPIDWKKVVDFDPNTQTYIDMRMQTTYLAYRIESTGDQYWKFYGMEVDFDVIGRALDGQ